MPDLIEDYLRNAIPRLSLTDLEKICGAATLQTLKRRETLLREGEQSRHKILVLSGLLRNYSIDESGQEHILKFVDQHSWTTDPESYYGEIPSRFIIEALEPSITASWEKKEFDRLRDEIPELNRYSETLITLTMAATQNRTLLMMSGRPEEKYLDFLKTFPNIFQRIPLHMIASYLGLSRETLTRVRQNLSALSKN